MWGGWVTSEWPINIILISKKTKQHKQFFLQHKPAQTEHKRLRLFWRPFVLGGGPTSRRSSCVLKGVIGCKIHFTSCLNINMLQVCVHPIMIKIHPVFFLNPYFKISFLKSGCSESPVRMMLFCTGPSHHSWLTSLTLDLPWVNCDLSASGAGEDDVSD